MTILAFAFAVAFAVWSTVAYNLLVRDRARVAGAWMWRFSDQYLRGAWRPLQTASCGLLITDH